MDADGSGNINIKELIDFLEAVGGGDIDKQVVSQAVSSVIRTNLLCGVFWVKQMIAKALDLNTKDGYSSVS